MRALAKLQSAFQSYVHDPERGRNEILGEIYNDVRVPARQRLEIYSDGYRLRLLEALGVDYPGLRALAGDAEFEAIGRAFIEANPSTYYNLRWYGGELPAFLRASEDYRAYGVLAEMADFEWAVATAFDAADDPVLRVEDVGSVAPDDWPEMRFRSHASMQLVGLVWDVVSVWKAANEEREAQAPEKGDAPVRWVVWRTGLKTMFRSLPADEAAALSALRDGTSFAGLCEILLEWHEPDAVAMRAAELLKQWTQAGMLSAFLDE